MVQTVQACCRGFLLGYQSSDTVCTVATISLKHFVMMVHSPTFLQIALLHENDGAHGAHGVRRLKHLRKTGAPCVHHRHHGDKRGQDSCVRCPDLTQNSPPACDGPGFFGQKTPDQLIGNRSLDVPNCFAHKWFFCGSVAELNFSTTEPLKQLYRLRNQGVNTTQLAIHCPAGLPEEWSFQIIGRPQSPDFLVIRLAKTEQPSFSFGAFPIML